MITRARIECRAASLSRPWRLRAVRPAGCGMTCIRKLTFPPETVPSRILVSGSFQEVRSGKRFKAEEIVNKLRQADVEFAPGRTVAAMCKLLGITDATYFRWRKEYGGMKVDQAKRLKALGQ